MKIRTLSTAAVVFAAVAAAPPAEASVLNGTITGVVTSAGSALSGVVDGSLVTGSYSYDPSTTFDGLVGPTHPLTAFSLAIGSNPQLFTLTDLQKGSLDKAGVVPDDSTSTDDDLFFLFKPAVIDAFIGETIIVQSIDNVPPQDYSVTADASHSFAFSFTALPAAAAAPEPATVALLALGCVAAIDGQRRRARRRPARPGVSSTVATHS